MLMSKPLWDKLSDADKKHFMDAAAEAVKVNRARIDKDDANGVEYLRSKGMEVVTEVDKSKFQDALKPAFADFNKRFGEAAVNRIRDFK